MRSINSENELASVAASLPDELGVPGVVVGLRRGDGPDWLAAAGLAEVETGREMSVSTPLRIASITKTFTATAIVRLSLEGRLGLDDPMVAHLPELARIQANGHPVESLLVRHFLTHRAGIVSDPPTRRWFEAPFPQIEEVLERIELVEVVCAPGTAEKYSNLGYALLGEVLTRVAGLPYGELMRRTLTGPAGMEATGLDAPSGRAFGYGLPRPDGWRRRPEQEFGAERPGGGMWSTAADLLTWAAVSQGLRECVLPAAVAARLLRPETVKGADLTTGRTLAWQLTRPAERLAHRHDGGAEGFTSSVAFCLADGSAAVVLTNGHSDAVPRVSQAMLGVDVPAPPAPRVAPVPDGSADGPVGHYLGPIEFSAWILPVKGGQLEISGPQFGDGADAVARLVPAGEDMFRLTAGRYRGELLELRRDAGGTVRAFEIGGYEHTRAEPPETVTRGG